jgi:hypothetical protein
MAFGQVALLSIPSAFIYGIVLALIGLVVARFTFSGPRKGLFTTLLVTGLILFYIGLYATFKVFNMKLV